MQWKADLQIYHMPNPTFRFFGSLNVISRHLMDLCCVVFCRNVRVQSTFICFILKVSVQKRDKKMFEVTGGAYNHVAEIA